ncbi:hypothetical protein B0H17DRAFT_1144547 [Mycena rosella]|uniref:Uncharacterized protein n=1 Tax=Mycena rosella TaxID=1033263 RepID=A0AAD7G397_MYCRO|nr:hypothetical protein B0H17DRAFT_1144547 [Mycena rosella]
MDAESVFEPFQAAVGAALRRGGAGLTRGRQEETAKRAGCGSDTATALHDAPPFRVLRAPLGSGGGARVVFVAVTCGCGCGVAALTADDEAEAARTGRRAHGTAAAPGDATSGPGHGTGSGRGHGRTMNERRTAQQARLRAPDVKTWWQGHRKRATQSGGEAIGDTVVAGGGREAGAVEEEPYHRKRRRRLLFRAHAAPPTPPAAGSGHARGAKETSWRRYAGPAERRERARDGYIHAGPPPCSHHTSESTRPLPRPPMGLLLRVLSGRMRVVVFTCGCGCCFRFGALGGGGDGGVPAHGDADGDAHKKEAARGAERRKRSDDATSGPRRGGGAGRGHDGAALLPALKRRARTPPTGEDQRRDATSGRETVWVVELDMVEPRTTNGAAGPRTCTVREAIHVRGASPTTPADSGHGGDGDARRGPAMERTCVEDSTLLVAGSEGATEAPSADDPARRCASPVDTTGRLEIGAAGGTSRKVAVSVEAGILTRGADKINAM